MDDRRYRVYLGVIFTLLFVAVVRVLLVRDPTLGLVEPVNEWLNEQTKSIFITKSPQASPSDVVASENELLIEENQVLRERLQLDAKNETIKGEVTRRDLGGFTKNVWISVGEEDGVREGQTVTANGRLFGIVLSTTRSNAIVRTVLDPEFRATVAIGKEHGVLKIQHGSLIVDLVPSKTMAGKSVRTDGFDGMLSADVPIGVLGVQISDESHVYGTYNVLLSENIYTTRLVEVINEEL